MRFRLRVVLGLPAAFAGAALFAQDVSYLFTTFAGTAGSVINSADGVGAAAQFDSPRGVAVDRLGTLYVADSSNHTIRRVTAGGAVTTLAGVAGREGGNDGAGTAARFTDPYAICVDAGGTIYVADTSNNKIRRITPEGVVTTLAGGGGQGSVDGIGAAARFREPRGIAVDPQGSVFVTDYGNNTVRKVTLDGVVTTVAGLAGSPGSADGIGSAARFRDLFGIAADAAGNLYVADSSNRAIRRISAAGEVTTIAGGPGDPGVIDGPAGVARFTDPHGVAIDGSGNIYVSEASGNVVRRITPSGLVTTIAGTPPRPGFASAGSDDGRGVTARFNGPFGVAADSGGNVFVADTANDVIRRISATGEVTTLAGLAGRTGNVDGTGAAARFHDPYSVAADGSGNVYVADYDSHTIRRITAAGAVSTFAGLAGNFGSTDGAGSAARFYFPTGIATDRSGNIYVADTSNRTIRKISPTGSVTTFAGQALAAGNSDGVGPTARFGEPHSLAVDNDDNVYVTDSANQTIRRITAGGVVTTFAGATGRPGSTDGVGGLARFTVPFGIGVDRRDGTVYVVDHGNQTIRRITPAGAVTTLAGAAGIAGVDDGTGGAARFAFPTALAVDRTGNVLVADTDNHAIRKITPAGVVTTVGGMARTPGSADGAGSVARFFNPKGIAIDRDDAIFVADRGNHTIRRGVVGAAPAGSATWLSNLSVRAAMAANQSLIVGFSVVGGAAPVLIRGAGPALGSLGVSGAMADPRLELYRDGAVVVQNDDWGNLAAISAAFVSVGAFAFSAGSKDAAMLLRLDGTHSVHLGGPGGGIALVELYDTGGTGFPRLANISVRGRVGTGDNILICGFYVSGAGSKRVLLRAVGGPRLEEFGVAGPLADPRLELHRAGSDALIAGNEDWESSLAMEFGRVGAFALIPGSKDAAMIVAVDASTGYTVQVRGADGGTGEALIEIYDLSP